MKFEELSSHLNVFSFKTSIGSHLGKILYDFVLDKKPSECLELGFGHGTSSCYIAAALDEIGTGHLTSVDLARAAEWQKPSIEELLLKTGLENVTVERENTSYTWFLKKKIEENSPSKYCQPIYVFCFIDGPKNWTIDGCAFFLVDKLLKQDGWILFDDYDFTYAEIRRRCGFDTMDFINLLELGTDELESPHIELIFNLLVMQHPNYSKFIIQDERWGWAQKTSSSLKKTLVIDTSFTFRAQLVRAFHRLKRFAARRIG